MKDELLLEGLNLFPKLFFQFHGPFLLFLYEIVYFSPDDQNLIADIDKLPIQDLMQMSIDHSVHHIRDILDDFLALDGQTRLLNAPGIFVYFFKSEGRFVRS
jgi:hypothetical protein